MVGLHSCPASSAGIERWFSTVGFIWSKTRNNLGVDKAQKLATVYRALRPAHDQGTGPGCLFHSCFYHPLQATAKVLGKETITKII